MEHNELDAATKARYEKQIEILESVCAEYEKEEASSAHEAKQRFDRISTLMMQLHSYGYPPEELVGETPPGWITDPQTGYPRVDDITKAAEACSLM
ncbi:unnamed protein product [Gongylonema pulchrum]|uniref:Peroxin-19 n=1 Tax=Gongylonema pulchrum TaxID=637853 RepID=A0A3P7NWM2_9BILA|nr:unnamed protein product [Gongylonema pulchrum]